MKPLPPEFHILVGNISIDPDVIVWMFISPPYSYVEILTPNGMIAKGEAFGRWLGHEEVALMDGISALVNESPETSLIPCALWGHREKMAICDTGGGPSSDAGSASIFIFPASQTPELCEINACCLKPPSLHYFC